MIQSYETRCSHMEALIDKFEKLTALQTDALNRLDISPRKV